MYVVDKEKAANGLEDPPLSQLVRIAQFQPHWPLLPVVRRF